MSDSLRHPVGGPRRAAGPSQSSRALVRSAHTTAPRGARGPAGAVLALIGLGLAAHASAAPLGGPAPSSSPSALPWPAGKTAISEADRAEARALYESTCVSCHGPAGRGDGLAAVGLPAKPASFADPAWQRTTSDDQIARAILGGGAAVGKNPLMPPNPQLANKPGVVAAMRAMIRGFAPAAPGAH